MLNKINNLTFLEDVSEDLVLPQLFKNSIKIFKVKDCPNIYFKIASDWEGNWLAGSWYVDNKKISHPDELLSYLSAADIRILVCHLDILDEISSWNKDKFMSFML